MTIDLCIVSHNTLPKLKRILSFAEDEESDLYNLYIQDNGSTDGSVEFLESYSNPNVKHIELSENVGYSAACNSLAKMGESEILCLLNADVWFTRPALEECHKFFDENQDVAIMGPKQVDERGHITAGGIFGTNEAPKHRGWQIKDPGDKLYKDIRDAVTIAGSAYFVRREVWDKLANCEIYNSHPIVQLTPYHGAFLPTPHYFEETFLSYHAREHGYRVVYNGMITFGHSWCASLKSTDTRLREFFLQSREIFRDACDHHGISHD